MVNNQRKESNWEAKFSNITYKQAKEIEKDKNIKEISIVKKIGITEENYAIPMEIQSVIKFDIREYDKNSLKNTNINLKEGRLPENSKEVVISAKLSNKSIMQEDIKLGGKLIGTIGGETKEYTIVRKSR